MRESTSMLVIAKSFFLRYCAGTDLPDVGIFLEDQGLTVDVMPL